MQVAAHAEIDRAGGALDDRLAHVVARVLRNVERQVAEHAGAVGARELALQVEHAGVLRAAARGGRVAGAPVGLGLALGVGVGEAQLRHLHLHGAVVELPLQLGREPVDGDHRVFEHAGEFERALGHGQRGGAAGVAGVEVERGAAEAGGAGVHARRRGGRAGRRRGALGGGGRRRLRGHAQAADPALGLVARDRVGRALPVHVDALDQAARRIGAQHAVRGLAQRQAVGDERQRREVEPVGLQRAVLGRAALGRRVLQPQVAAGPAQAVDGVELQGGGRELEGVRVHLPRQPAGDGAQHQRLQPLAERGVDAVQAQVGRAADDAPVVHVGPQAQRAVAFADARVERDVLAQARDVDVGQVGIELAVPGLPVAAADRQQRLAELAAQREALAPAGRRRGIQPQAVAARAVAGHEAHVGQQQRFGAALLVGPAHGAAFDDELALREKPVGGAGFSGRVGLHVQSSHMEFSLSVAAHVELRALDIELLEIQAPERARRHARHHPHEAKGLALVCVLQHHVAQFEGRK
ncbi:hypothetical protein FQZ97_570420 [compost metagenome]